MGDDLDAFVVEQMRDPEFARYYEREQRSSERFTRRRRRLCRLGVHRLSFSDGETNYCACYERLVERSDG